MKVKEESEKAGLKLNIQKTKIVASSSFSSVQSLSRVQLFVTRLTAARQGSPGVKATPSDAIQPSHPLSSPSPPAPNPSQHQSLFQ